MTGKIFLFITPYVSIMRKTKELKNEYNTYAASFHQVKLHLAEALQYHEKLKEKAFESAITSRIS